MVEPIQVIETTQYRQWLDALRDEAAKARIAARARRLEAGLFGNTRSVGGGVSELKLDFGPGYRVYFGRKRNRLILLLCGGDKSTQRRDIVEALEIWERWKDKI